MKKRLVLLSVFILSFIFFLVIGFNNNVAQAANKSTNSRCLTLTGQFIAKNWSGGSMMVGCSGDNGKYCKGQVANVKPNKTFTLTKCSCPPYASGCLVIGKKVVLKKDGPSNRPRAHVVGDKVPNKCVLTHKSNMCGVNGQVINVDFKVTCKAPTPTNTPTPTITNTPTPTPSICVVPEPVINVKITCPNCNQGLAPTPTLIQEGGSCATNGGPEDGGCAEGLTCQINGVADDTRDGVVGTCVSSNGGNQ